MSGAASPAAPAAPDDADVFGRVPEGVVALDDWTEHARAALPPDRWAYLAGHAGDGHAARRNREAFARAEIVPRLLLDDRVADTGTVLLGRRIAFPVLVAPVAHQGLFHPLAERATAMAAAAVDTIFVASTLSTLSLEDIADVRDVGGRWFQLYVQPDRGLTDDLVARAEAAGYEALVITVDAPVFGVRNVEQRAGFHLPEELAPANLAGAQPPDTAGGEGIAALLAHRPTWAEIERIVTRTRLPVILKGILHADDAARAMASGAVGVVVSNHGGRVLDAAPAALDGVAPIRDRLGDGATVLMDGGVRRGSDVWTALARGADAVMVGRPIAEALAAGGPLGVAHALKTLGEEYAVTIALAGRPRP